MLGEFHNRTCRRQAYDCDKGMEEVVLEKGRPCARHNTIFSMTWLGSQVAKKVRLSMRA